ncbi:MAG: YdbH domain-containing protein [Phycisphaerales bacterium]|nr:YdbH domain-containing protein [Phycisphaerales bacterium]
MIRRRRWTPRLVRVAGLMIAAALVFFVVALPAIARSRVNRVLASMGADTAAFDVQSVSLRHLELANIGLGRSNWLTVSDIAVEYDIGSILAGDVRTIELTGAQWRISVVGNRIELGFQPEIDAEQPYRLPFRQLVLRDSTVVIDWDGHPLRFQVEGTLTRVSAGSLDVDLQLSAPHELVLPWKNLALTGLQTDLHLHADLRPGELKLHALSNHGSIVSSIHADTIRIGEGPALTSISAPVLQVTQPASRPLLRVAYGAELEPGYWLDAEIASLHDLSFTTEAGNGAIEHLAARVQLDAPKSAEMILDAELSVNNGSFTSDSPDVSLAGISATVPIAINLPSSDSGQFSIQSIAWRGVEWPPLAGSIRANGRRIDADATWPFMTGAVAATTAWMELGPNGIRGELSSNIPPFNLDESSSSTIQTLVPQLNRVDISGTWSADARITIENGRLQPFVRLSAQNAGFSHSDWPAAIDSASGALTFDGFAPLSMPGPQRIDIHDARIGDLDVRDALVIFEVVNPNTVAVHQASWSMLELGQFHAEPFRLDPARPQIHAQLHVENASLDRWLNLVSDGRMSGQGTLVGSIMLSIDPQADQTMNFGQGLLHAQPSFGWFAINDPKAIERLIDQGNWQLGNNEHAAAVRDRVVQALSNFEYSLLRFELTPSGDEVRCRVHTIGKGGGSADAQELDLTLNLNSFDLLLRAAVLGKSLWDLTE